ncbi:probable ATP-dependent RNA helicase DHX35, partial [Sinocyclocheilus grahami]|uniref:probable ATP-dependent RNA helicase DHX35 n=1 Tax=Sinocyclocheilus grahami TaxID=75366 RepID=UPI0007AC85C1
SVSLSGSEAPGVCEERDLCTDTAGSPIIYNPHTALSIEKQRQRLPVFKHRNNILYLVESFQTVVIVGETGSGKSTQIPQYLLEAGWAADGKVIGVTQPRRVAATSVAGRVAEERGAYLGHEVGYSIRFDDCSDPHATRIKFLTDGMLVREMMSDPLLKKYSVIMLDEAHERTLYTDITIGLLKKIQKKRRDLRLIVASATLDAKKFHDFFDLNESGDPNKDTCAILTVEGRTFPVDIFYTVSPVPDYVKATVETVMKIHETEDDGDVLAFLTGQEEVEKVVSMLQEQARTLSRYGMKKHLCVLPMYAGLPYNEQMRVFERMPPTVRKVVVATNIAETSITINGVVFVIDCAFVKLRAYNPRTAIESLIVTPISKASACQRAGRAGRNRAGKCFRLYTGTVRSYKFLTVIHRNSPLSNVVSVCHYMTVFGMCSVISHSSVCAAGDPDVILRCIVSGFFANAARMHHSGSYRTLRDDRELFIHPDSVLYGEKPPKWVVFNEVVQTSKYYMRDVTAVESSWLVELAPHFYKQAKHGSLNSKRAKVF